MINNYIDNGNDDRLIKELFLDIINNMTILYNYNNDELSKELKLKNEEGEKVRKEKYDKKTKDEQKIQQLYREFNLGNKYEDIEESNYMNINVNDLENLNSVEYKDENKVIDNSDFIESNEDETNDLLLVSNNNDYGDGNNDEFID
jgi:hypothetical protein